MPPVASTGQPTRKSLRTANGRRTRSVVHRAIDDLNRIRLDSGVSLRRWAAAAAVDSGFLSQILASKREPSVATLVALASPLGAELSVRAYPSAGPLIYDRNQARIVEELLRITDPSWDRVVEVPVLKPARGFIDVVFDSLRRGSMIATEVATRLDRVEQALRWAQDKAQSLPSSDLWSRTHGDRVIARLLVLRSTTATRAIARRFEATLHAAYPAKSVDVYAALTTGAEPWPGDGILWANVTGDAVRILSGPPRGVSLGR